jgi:hypothetical protein
LDEDNKENTTPTDQILSSNSQPEENGIVQSTEDHSNKSNTSNNETPSDVIVQGD